MHPILSLVSGTPEAAAAVLAKRAVAIERGGARMSKEALDKSAILSRIGDWYSGLSPLARKSLVSGGIGAGLGAGMGLASSAFGDEEGKSSPGRSAITGALAGGATGLGVGMLSHYNPWKKPDGAPPEQPSLKVKPETPLSATQKMMELNRTATEGGWGTAGAVGGTSAGIGAAGLGVKRMLTPNIQAHEAKNVDSLRKGIQKYLSDASLQKSRGYDLKVLNYLSTLSQARLRDIAHGKTSGGQLPKPIMDLTQIGAHAEMPKAVAEAGGTPLFRKSRLGQLLPKRFEPHINTALPLTKWRSRGKLGLLAAGLGLLGGAAGLGGARWKAQHELNPMVEHYSTPAE
jgi:hypothetical protein